MIRKCKLMYKIIAAFEFISLKQYYLHEILNNCSYQIAI